jgi:tol-pal system protein YbgF
MRITTTLLATLLLGSAVHSQAPTTRDTGQAAAAPDTDALHRKLDELSARFEVMRKQLEKCLGPGAKTGTTPPPQTDGRALYNAAHNDYLKGSYDEALRQFQNYVTTFPSSDLADNAHYWIGETYYRQQRFRQAIEKFAAITRDYPRSDRVAAALLKRSYSHLELGERSQGVLHLQTLVRRYPTTDEAILARQRLRELGIGGG